MFFAAKYPHPNPLPEGEGIPELLRNKIKNFISFASAKVSSPLSLWERARVRVLSTHA
jgi:hypothetical protein